MTSLRLTRIDVFNKLVGNVRWKSRTTTKNELTKIKPTVITGVLPAPVYNPHPPKWINMFLKSVYYSHRCITRNLTIRKNVDFQWNNISIICSEKQNIYHDFSCKKITFPEVYLFRLLINHSYPIYAITLNHLLRECIWND